ncbi:hypothetical protein ES703_50588 [subsurface metagenome]
MFFTARFARDTEFAEKKYVFFSADPGGIGSAFHRAEEGRKENDLRFGETKKP